MDLGAIGRIPPQSIEAEKSILGSMMLDNEIVIDVLDALEPDDFFREDHKEIFRIISDLSQELQPTDIITVSDKLKDRGILEKVGGLKALSEMADTVLTTSTVKHHVQLVLNSSKRRKLIKTAQNILNNSYESEDIDITIDLAEKSILSINERRQSNFCLLNEAATSAMYQLEERMRNKGQLTGLSTGFYDLDAMLGGIKDGDLIIIAARPSMGKTSLAENIITFNSAIKNHPTAFFSMEMPKESIANRIFSAWGRVDNKKIKLGTINDHEITNIARVFSFIKDSKLVIDDTPHIRASEIRSKCRRIKNKFGDLRLIVADHLTEMWRPNKGDSRAEHEENVRSMKRLAREMKCPVILLQQLNRGTEARQDKRPMLSDLKETGASEEAADVVMLIYRDDYYNPSSEKKGIAEIIVAKNREGETGPVELLWQGQYTKFSNIEKYRTEEYEQEQIRG
jgi:replicative DNA helicase